jgi:hypothetical protein
MLNLLSADRLRPVKDVSVDDWMTSVSLGDSVAVVYMPSWKELMMHMESACTTQPFDKILSDYLRTKEGYVQRIGYDGLALAPLRRVHGQWIRASSLFAAASVVEKNELLIFREAIARLTEFHPAYAEDITATISGRINNYVAQRQRSYERLNS